MGKTQETEKGVISPELIFLDQKMSNQEDVIQFIVKKAASSNYVSNAAELYAAVKKREAEVSTAIGYDIAIPHGKTTAVTQPFIAFLRVQEAFRWAQSNEENVRLIFLIGVPQESENKLHLKFISQLSKRLLNDEFREKLITEIDPNKIFEQLSSIEI
jgi:PTS system fructose-specific IIA component